MNKVAFRIDTPWGDSAKALNAFARGVHDVSFENKVFCMIQAPSTVIGEILIAVKEETSRGPKNEVPARVGRAAATALAEEGFVVQENAVHVDLAQQPVRAGWQITVRSLSEAKAA